MPALEKYRETLAGIVVESTYNWYWLVDGLKANGYIVKLAHTAETAKKSNKKYSDDYREAFTLADLLRKGDYFVRQTRETPGIMSAIPAAFLLPVRLNRPFTIMARLLLAFMSIPPSRIITVVYLILVVVTVPTMRLCWWVGAILIGS